MAYLARRSRPALRRDCLPSCMGISFLSVDIRIRFQRSDHADEVRTPNLDTRNYRFGERAIRENKRKNSNTHKFCASSNVLRRSNGCDMSTEFWRLVEAAPMVIGLASTFLAAPVSLAFAWLGWIRIDCHEQDSWRTKILRPALLLVSSAAACYLLAFGLQWATRGREPHGYKALTDSVCIAGAIFCLLGLVVAAFGKGRTRVPIGCAGMFGLFLFLQSTPLAWLP